MKKPCKQTGKRPPTRALQANQQALTKARDEAREKEHESPTVVAQVTMPPTALLHLMTNANKSGTRHSRKSSLRHSRRRSRSSRLSVLPKLPKPDSMKLELNTPPRALLVVRQQNNRQRTVFVRRARISPASVCSQYVYILDDVPAQQCVLYIGADANKHTVMYAVKLWEDIVKKERQSRPRLVRVDEREDNSARTAEGSAFWRALGGTGRETAPREPPTEVAATAGAADVLYRCEPCGTGFELVCLGRPERAKIASSGCYVLDAHTEVFVWVGNATPLKTRRAQYTAAARLGMAARERPAWVTAPDVITEGYESELFKAKLADWAAPQLQARQAVLDKVLRDGLHLGAADSHFDAHTMLAPPSRALLDRRFEGAENTRAGGVVLELYRVKGDDKVAVPRALWGHFWDAESYIVLYRYPFKNTFFYVTYFWQGRRCRIVDKGKAAALTVKLAEQRKLESVQLRVPQGKETAHFLQVFGSVVVVHSGPQPEDGAAAAAATAATDVVAGTAPALYRVCPEVTPTTFVVLEVPRDEAQLNSNTCFVLAAGERTVTLWTGAHCSRERVPPTPVLAERFSQVSRGSGPVTVQTVTEDRDDRAFCAALAHSSNSTSTSGSAGRVRTRCGEARLWCCDCTQASRETNGVFAATGVASFTADDLDESHTAILDTGAGLVCAWLGRTSPWPERLCTARAALAYGELVGAQARVVPSGSEAAEPLFVHAFAGAWSRPGSSSSSGSSGSSSSGSSGKSMPAKAFLDDIERKYTLAELQALSNPMRSIDGNNLENHLTDSAFVETFDMTRSTFRRLPPWKRHEKKQRVGLF